MKFDFENKKQEEYQEDMKNDRELISDGVSKIYLEGMPMYGKVDVIDGLEYAFFLSKVNDTWDLSFISDYGNLITNKGLSVFNKVVDNLVSLVNTVRTKETIREIKFGGSGAELGPNSIEEFKNFLNSKIAENSLILEGFEYSKIEHGAEKKVRIENGKIVITQKSSTDQNFDFEYKWKLQDFIDNHLENILDDRILIQKIVEYTGEDFSMIQRKEKDATRQRVDLYERTLKQRFPDQKFSREGNSITIYFDNTK